MDVFVYGTLTNPDRVRTVVDSFVFVGPAVLEGLRVVDGECPTLAPPADGGGSGSSDGGSNVDASNADASGGGMAGPDVAGRLLRTNEVDALDAYEGVEDGLYVRVSVPVVDETAGSRTTGHEAGASRSDGAAEGAGEAAVYVGDPDRLGAPAAWPGDGPLRERVERVLRERPVEVRIPPTG
ncbi:gamma-glutamylcyclotransferase family protein [Halorarum salinum]|uniref:Gamma-glutamylcyclotransferase n=1 Tax=Halorarum salinum TaxID=2743089 RepID=A0A7D5QJH6_9EURY|nr:gamma-glutamylcyclotransferase family protein [Halobaculum salinum]QLG63764.1 gamma-glutamylcyclotransferase [Halobaculum salinum]